MNAFCLLVGMQKGYSQFENSMEYLAELAYDLAIPLLGSNLSELKTCPHKHVYTNVSTAVFIVAQTQKYTKCTWCRRIDQVRPVHSTKC